MPGTSQQRSTTTVVENLKGGAVSGSTTTALGALTSLAMTTSSLPYPQGIATLALMIHEVCDFSYKAPTALMFSSAELGRQLHRAVHDSRTDDLAYGSSLQLRQTSVRNL